MSAQISNEFDVLHLDEGAYPTRLTRKYRDRDAWERPDPSKVLSYIPGMVVRVMATEGERLPAGAPLLTIEAMKMENTLTMPCDGAVKRLLVKVGDVLPKNSVLAEIELEVAEDAAELALVQAEAFATQPATA